MSTAPAQVQRRVAEPRPVAPRKPDLTVVPPPRLRAPKAPFVVLVLALLGGGLVALLLLNTALAQGAFTLHDLQRRGVTLTETQQALERQLADEQQPGALARRAKALGMVPGGVPAFVRLPGGKILGRPHTAVPVPPPATAPASSLPTATRTTAAATPATKAHKPATKAHKSRAGTPAAGTGAAGTARRSHAQPTRGTP